MRSLEKAHPLSCMLYILAVMGITIFTRSPVLIAESLAGAAALLLLCRKGQLLWWGAAAAAACAVTNPLFSHSGDTALFFIGDAAYTLEALVYGGIFGGMLAAVCGWSVLAARFVTSDKYIWLFGRILPVSGLVLSSSLRLIPLFLRRIRDFSAGEDTLRGKLSAFSASLGYSAEQSMESADSMRARGYGTARRTSFSIYRFGARELLQFSIIASAGIVSAAAMVCGGGEYSCYPRLSELSFGMADVLLYIFFGILCLLPTAVALCEEVRRATAAYQR